MNVEHFRAGMAALLLLAAPQSAFAQTSPDPVGLSVEIMARYAGADGTVTVSSVTDQSTLASGDEVQIRLRVERDAYVYVFAHGSSGAALLRQPFSGLPEDGFMRAGEVRIIPGADQYLPLDSRTGRESIYAVAMDAPPVPAPPEDRLGERGIADAPAGGVTVGVEPPAPAPDVPAAVVSAEPPGEQASPAMAPPGGRLLLGLDEAPSPAPAEVRAIDIASGDNVSSAVVRVVTPSHSGSGVLLDDAGHVLTNWHLVQGYPAVSVGFKDATGIAPSARRTRAAQVVMLSKSADLALLRVDGARRNAIPARLAKTNEIRNGETVHVVGHLEGGDWTHSLGTIARVKAGSSRYAGHNLLRRGTVIEVELPQDPGSAGASLFNGRLELVGIGAMPRSTRGVLTGVSVETIRRFLDAMPPAAGVIAGN